MSAARSRSRDLGARRRRRARDAGSHRADAARAGRVRAVPRVRRVQPRAFAGVRDLAPARAGRHPARRARRVAGRHRPERQPSSAPSARRCRVPPGRRSPTRSSTPTGPAPPAVPRPRASSGSRALITGTTLMGQMERALNRLYGIEQDRPTAAEVRARARARAHRRRAGDGRVRDVRPRARHRREPRRRHGARRSGTSSVGPSRLVLMMAAIALLFRWSPNRHQPAWSWLAFGSTVSVLLWSLVDARARVLLPGQHDVQHHVRSARGDDRDPAVVAAVVDRDPVRCRDRGAARGGARRRAPAPQDERKVEWASGQGSPALAGTRLRRCRSSDWFLAASERGNPATEIDRRHGDGAAWTEGNDGHGARSTAPSTSPGCTRCSASAARATGCSSPTGRAIPTSCSTVPAPRSARCSPSSPAAGVNVRGLLWRSHPEAMNFGEGEEPRRSRAPVNEAGGQVLLDHRVRRGGSHHQKLVVVQHDDPARDVAFVGGIDLCHGRRDDRRHLGDPAGGRARRRALRRAAAVARPAARAARSRRSTTSRARSPSGGDDPNPLDTRNPLRSVLHRVANHPHAPGALPPSRPRGRPDGPLAVQVLRTYPAAPAPYPFAPEGERSIARAYLKAFSRARRLIYLEDQYLWSLAATRRAARRAGRTTPSCTSRS